ncbi:Fungal specific transcription factor domain-containing protein [Cladophialophora immunda]|nr:Fungal specific transcription factor domain-containing protein [Cladophialophora immunda]
MITLQYHNEALSLHRRGKTFSQTLLPSIGLAATMLSRTQRLSTAMPRDDLLNTVEAQSLSRGTVSPSVEHQNQSLEVSSLSAMRSPHPRNYSSSLVRIWQSCHFVHMGWLTPREAIQYVDLFFKNMSPLSPVLTDFYAQHSNHLQLITQEPMLCCTILMISSRYHVLPGVGSAAKGYFLHNRLWKHCEHLILRIMLGQEKGAQTRARSVGSIEALLLISEWHPRSLHFPPESHGWDADLLQRSSQDRDVEMNEADAFPDEEGTNPSAQWLEEVIEPTRRSDRMSWMLLGCAMSLAHELGVYDHKTYCSSTLPPQTREKEIQDRKRRLQKLLYVFHTQLALRLGYTSSMASSLHHMIPKAHCPTGLPLPESLQWDLFMDAQIDLTKLSISISDVFFSSPSSTRALLLSGRFAHHVDNFQNLLTRWYNDHLQSNRITDTNLALTTSIEYNSMRALLSSVGMQAIVEKTLENNPGLMPEEARPVVAGDSDYEYVQQVLDSCSEILKLFQGYAGKDNLFQLPSRIVYRVFMSSILLLKALSIGVRQSQFDASLDILNSSIQALRSQRLDDLHCLPRYAGLLDIQLKRLRRYFAESSRYPSSSAAGATTVPGMPADSATTAREAESQASETNGPRLGPELEWPDLNMENWLRLPFDPSMAPFDLTGSLSQTGLDLNGLDFMWNLGHE